MSAPGATAGAHRYDLLGTMVTVSTDSDDVATQLDRLLAPFRVADAPDGPGRTDGTDGGGSTGDNDFSIEVDRATGRCDLWHRGEALLRTPFWPAAVALLVQELNFQALDGFAGFAVHSGAVADGAGVIAFPAPSGRGKSTMVAACLATGFDYVSDEALCVEFDSRRVVPYCKPIRLPSASVVFQAATRGEGHLSGNEGEAFVVPEDIGATRASPPLDVSHVVCLERRPGPTVLTEVPAARACDWLLRFSFNHHKQPEASFDLATALARQASAWRLEYEEAPVGAQLLRQRLARRSGSDPSGS